MLTEKLYIGGLMRCCLGTWEDERGGKTDKPQEGDVIECKYCDGKIVYQGDGWRWKDEAGE